MRKLPIIALVVSVVALLSMPTSAHADTFSFTISGLGTTASGTSSTVKISASGTITATPEGDGSYLVTSISGTLSISGTPNPSAMTILPVNSFDGNDNLLLSPGSPDDLDGDGISFSAGGVDYNLFYRGAISSYVLDIGPGNLAQVGQEVTFDPVPVSMPEPPSFLLIAVGLGGVGLLSRKLRLAASS